MSPEQLKVIALETIDNPFPTNEGLHVFNDGFFLDRYHGAGACIFYELLSFYLPLGIFTTAFDDEIEAIALAVGQLSPRSSDFNRTVIFSDSKLVLQALSQNYLCHSRRILKCRSFLKEFPHHISFPTGSMRHCWE
ncbi:hypothetical protein TNCV_3155091 [Trichonephila clavipes]|nr:hypothetical protein TNCV_3155091 [Trichonephila clavipes]